MTDLTRFLGYVQAFELAHLTDDWSLIAPHFAPGAVHRVAGGPPFAAHDAGREAVVAGLAESVRTIDRRFDARVAEIVAGPEIRDGGIWMRFRLTLCRTGLPDLVAEGEHHAFYDGGDAIARLEEAIDLDASAATAAYLARHAALLRPAGSPPALPADPHHLARVDAGVRGALVRCYGLAKSRQDAEAALAICHPHFTIETVSFGVASADRADTAAQLAVFFAAFPDYAFALEGLAAGADGTACWGTVRMIFAGDFLGLAPTGRTASLPAFCVFDFQDGLLARERFLFDCATLCEQIGVPIAALSERLRQLRPAA